MESDGQVIWLANVSLEANTDTRVEITNLTNPSVAGGYGPFKIATRWFKYGQIIDINRAFGTVGLYKEV